MAWVSRSGPALHDRPASLTITHGLSGSGKTTGTRPFIEQQGAIRLRSDVERKRLFDIDPARSRAVPVDTGIYSPDASTRTYEKLAELARTVVLSGFPVVIDATFLQWARRSTFRRLADELGVPFRILAFDADEPVLRERIARRFAAGDDASDATRDVLARQLQTREPLTSEELAFVAPHP